MRLSMCKSFWHVCNELLYYLPVERVICERRGKGWSNNDYKVLLQMQIQLFIPDALLLTRTKEHHIPYSHTRTRTHTHTHTACLQHLTSSGCTTLAGSSYMPFASSPTGSHSTLSHSCTAAKILCFSEQCVVRYM